MDEPTERLFSLCIKQSEMIFKLRDDLINIGSSLREAALNMPIQEERKVVEFLRDKAEETFKLASTPAPELEEDHSLHTIQHGIIPSR